MRFVRDVSLVFRRSLEKARRAPQMAFVFPVLFPTFVVGLMSQLYRDLARVPGFPAPTYVGWMAPSVFLMAAMFGAGFSAQGLVSDATSGYLDRLRLLPIHPAALMLGRLLFDVVRVGAAGVLVLGVSVALGAELSAGPGGVAAMLVLLGLWTLAYGGMFYVVGLRARSPDALAALIPLFMPIAMLSTAFVPRSSMPGWIAVVSRLNPFSYVVEAVRGLMVGTWTWASVASGVAAAGAVVALTLVASARPFSRLVARD